MKAFFLFWIIGFSYLQAQTLSADSLHYWLHTKNRVVNPGKELLKTFQLIPRDTITLGSSYDSLYPAHSLTVYDFFIQNTEVTNIFYRTFIAYVLEDSAEGAWQKYMPDLSCWTQDFPEDSLEELNTLYFLHPMYSYYPVVGVSWEQSIAFAQWAEKIMKEYLASNPKIANRYRMGALRLPTEDEFEFAAGGLSLMDYPWGMGGTESIYCLNPKGKNFLANFMPGAQDYSLDGFDITSPVGSFPPNAFHLYDMAGNVSEWCSDIYRENRFHDSLYSKTSGFRTQLHDHSTEIQASRVVKGGSWKDPAALLRIYSREGVFQDKKHSYIGFRLAATRQAE